MRKIRYGQRKLSDEQREQTERDWADAVTEALLHPELREERQRMARDQAEAAARRHAVWLSNG